VVLLGVAYSWLWFRAPGTEAAMMATTGMLSSVDGGAAMLRAQFGAKELFALGAWLFIDFSRFSPERSLAERQDLAVTAVNAIVLAGMVAAAIFLRGVGDAFIYFQF